MRCEKCGYVFQPLDEKCLRCGWKEGDRVEGRPAPPSVHARSSAAAVAAPASADHLLATGALTGALAGAVFSLAFALAGRFMGGQQGEMGLVASLGIALAAGAIIGAIVGLVVAATRSVPAGIVTGAVVDAGVKLTVMGGLGIWWGFTLFGVIWSLFVGAIFGWVVASQVNGALTKAK